MVNGLEHIQHLIVITIKPSEIRSGFTRYSGVITVVFRIQDRTAISSQADIFIFREMLIVMLPVRGLPFFPTPRRAVT
jgi:hypothetical protein